MPLSPELFPGTSGVKSGAGTMRRLRAGLTTLPDPKSTFLNAFRTTRRASSTQQSEYSKGAREGRADRPALGAVTQIEAAGWARGAAAPRWS